MSEPEKASEHLSQYLRQLPPQVRSRLLAELERLHLLGEDIPRTEAMMAALRAEFRMRYADSAFSLRRFDESLDVASEQQAGMPFCEATP